MPETNKKNIYILIAASNNKVSSLAFAASKCLCALLIRTQTRDAAWFRMIWLYAMHSEICDWPHSCSASSTCFAFFVSIFCCCIVDLLHWSCAKCCMPKQFIWNTNIALTYRSLQFASNGNIGAVRCVLNAENKIHHKSTKCKATVAALSGDGRRPLSIYSINLNERTDVKFINIQAFCNNRLSLRIFYRLLRLFDSDLCSFATASLVLLTQMATTFRIATK